MGTAGSTMDLGVGQVSTPSAPPLSVLKQTVEPYAHPEVRRSITQMFTTLGPLALLMWASHVTLQWSWPVALLFVLPIAGLLVRTFIIMHDCAHSSFLPSRKWNDGIGFITGVITFTPFLQWRRDHALHHASSGDLDRRGNGDVPTLTVREYLERTPGKRLLYRIIRHPMALMFGGPIHLLFSQRFRSRSKATKTTQIWSVASTNIAIVAGITIAVLLVGWKTVTFAYFIPFYFAGMSGVWLFYVQHQFEDAYWASGKDWDYVEACLHGSSHLKLPAVLNWFTGNIGLHHVHHLAPRIPNYRLPACHEDNKEFQVAPVVTIRSGMAALRLALWDEDSQRLVSFADVDKAAKQVTARA
jgi:omega-6 fatty acid desaturase (delta-12 desaturase)